MLYVPSLVTAIWLIRNLDNLDSNNQHSIEF
jgi:hypothetical protein